jgi:hypothetical protein
MRGRTIATALRGGIEEGSSFHEWIGKASDEFDQIGLAVGARLFKDVAEMSLYGRGGNTKYLCDFRHATNINDGKQDAEFRHRQLVGFGDNFWRGWGLYSGLMYEYCGARSVIRARSVSRARGEWQNMGNVAFTALSDERQRNTASTNCRIALGGCEKDFLQTRVDLRFACHQFTRCDLDDVSFGYEEVTGSVGMNDAAVGIDQKYCGPKTLERL